MFSQENCYIYYILHVSVQWLSHFHVQKITSNKQVSRFHLINTMLKTESTSKRWKVWACEKFWFENYSKTSIYFRCCEKESELYSEPSQTSKTKLFVEIVEG